MASAATDRRFGARRTRPPTQPATPRVSGLLTALGSTERAALGCPRTSGIIAGRRVRYRRIGGGPGGKFRRSVLAVASANTRDSAVDPRRAAQEFDRTHVPMSILGFDGAHCSSDRVDAAISRDGAAVAGAGERVARGVGSFGARAGDDARFAGATAGNGGRVAACVEHAASAVERRQPGWRLVDGGIGRGFGVDETVASHHRVGVGDGDEFVGAEVLGDERAVGELPHGFAAYESPY